MSVAFNINVSLVTPQDFDELRKLYEEMRSHYAIHCGRHDYVVTIANAGPPGGFVASGLRVNLKDWRVQFTRDDTPTSKEALQGDTSEER